VGGMHAAIIGNLHPLRPVLCARLSSVDRPAVPPRGQMRRTVQ